MLPFDIKVAVDHIKEKVPLLTIPQAVKIVTEVEKAMALLPYRYKIPLDLAGMLEQKMSRGIRYHLMKLMGITLDVNLIEMYTKVSIKVVKGEETLVERTAPLNIQYPEPASLD